MYIYISITWHYSTLLLHLHYLTFAWAVTLTLLLTWRDMQSIPLHGIAPHYIHIHITSQYMHIAFQYITLHDMTCTSALHTSIHTLRAFNCIALHFIALHYTFHYATLRCITSHHIAWHHIAMRYLTLTLHLQHLALTLTLVLTLALHYMCIIIYMCSCMCTCIHMCLYTHKCIKLAFGVAAHMCLLHVRFNASSHACIHMGLFCALACLCLCFQ